MSIADIDRSLTKIILFYESIVRESCYDPSAYEYIASQSVLLKMAAFRLGDRVENVMLRDKRARLKLLKLHKALNNLVNALDLPVEEEKDKKYIDDVLTRLRMVKEDIEVIKQYQ